MTMGHQSPVSLVTKRALSVAILQRTSVLRARMGITCRALNASSVSWDAKSAPLQQFSVPSATQGTFTTPQPAPASPQGATRPAPLAQPSQT